MLRNWDEIFSEACPEFRRRLEILKGIEDEGLGKEWSQRKTMVFVRIGELETAFPQLAEDERILLRGAMQRIQVLRNAKRSRLQMDESRAMAFALFMLISTKLASLFDQFYHAMLEIEYLLLERDLVKA